MRPLRVDLISFDGERWPRCSLTQSYRVRPTIWLVKTVKPHIVKPARHRKRFLLRRSDLSRPTFALGYDAICPSGRTRSSIQSMRTHPRSTARRDRLPAGAFVRWEPCPARSAHSGKRPLNGCVGGRACGRQIRSACAPSATANRLRELAWSFVRHPPATLRKIA